MIPGATVFQRLSVLRLVAYSDPSVITGILDKCYYTTWEQMVAIWSGERARRWLADGRKANFNKARSTRGGSGHKGIGV